MITAAKKIAGFVVTERFVFSDFTPSVKNAGNFAGTSFYSGPPL